MQGNVRWFAAPQNDVGASKLHAALVETLVTVEEVGDDREQQLKRVRAIRERLGESVKMILKSTQKGISEFGVN